MSKKKFLIVSLIIIVFFIMLSFNLLNKNKYNQKIVFLGDSIIERYDLKKYYSKYNIVNSGVGGNQTIDILNDLDNRVYKYKPQKVFLLVGTNDLAFSNLNNTEITNNIKQIVNKIHKKLPDTKIYVQSVYPVNYDVDMNIVSTRKNEDIKDLNTKIKDICKENECKYINMYNLLKDGKGNLSRIYTTDGLHINRVGYRLITIKLLKYINE